MHATTTLLACMAHYPDTDVFDPPAWIGVGIVSLAWLGVGDFMPSFLRKTVLMLHPYPFAGLLLFGMAVSDHYFFASIFVMMILLTAFGFGLALVSIRQGSTAFVIQGVVSSYVFGWSAFMLFGQLFQYRFQTGGGTFLFVSCISPMVWTPWVMSLAHRAKLNYAQRNQFICAKCGYDLRGSIGRPACPECGEPIPPLPATAASPEIHS